MEEKKEPVKIQHGHWVTTETSYEWLEDYCSVCGKFQDAFCELKVCPNCGAIMDEKRQ